MKKLLSLILVMVLVCAAAAAETPEKEQGLYRYRVKEDGTAEIIGVSESIQDGNIPAELDGYKVTSIGSFAFDECSNLKEVRIPEGVTAILPEAFIRCRELTSVSIPDSMVDIGGSAETGIYGGVPFMACPKLESIEISPDHPVFAFADHALINRQDMALVYFAYPDYTGVYEIPGGIKRIEAYAFYLHPFTSVIIPDSVTYIGHSSFSECENLKEVIIPESVTEIEADAFRDCSDDLVIKAPAGSAAEKYCEENEIKFEVLK